MGKINFQQEGNILYMTVSGKLDDSDYDKLVPRLREMMDEYKEIRWLIKLEDFEGWSPHAFWRDISFALSNRLQLRKLGIVGDNQWHEAMAEVFEVYTANDVEYFNRDHEKQAREWIKD